MVKNPEQTALISQYIFNLAKYDMSYDIRDRGRLLRHVLFNQSNVPILSSRMKDLFITTKPSPVPPSYDMRFMVGSLAQTVGHTTPCYNALPEWPDQIQNSELRKVYEPEPPVFNKFFGFGSGSSTSLPERSSTSSYSNTTGTPVREFSNNLEDFLNAKEYEEQYPEEGEEGYDGEYYEGDEGQEYYEGQEGYEGEEVYYEGQEGYEGEEGDYEVQEGYEEGYDGYQEVHEYPDDGSYYEGGEVTV
jgi:AP-3 complex subunit beta